VKLVLDPNVLLAAVLVPGLCRELVSKELHAHELCFSEELLAEFADKLESTFDLPPLDLPFYVAYRDRVTRVRPLKLDKPVCRDPDDDVVIATALAAHARAIITGDKDLLVLKQHAGVRMITPRQFLELRITN